MSYGCLVSVYVMWFFLMESWVGLQCVIMVFPDHTHLICFLFCCILLKTHTCIHCIYMYFTPDCKHILTKLGRYDVSF